MMSNSSNDFYNQVFQELEELFEEGNTLIQRIQNLLGMHEDLLDDTSETSQEDHDNLPGRDDEIVTTDDAQADLMALIASELECPVCYHPMLGTLHKPMHCSNGHACCLRCTYRLGWISGRTCPTCRAPIGRWGRCLLVERLGSLLVDRGLLMPSIEEEQTDRVEQEGQRRRRSARLARARRHMEMWRREGDMIQSGGNARESHEEEDSGYYEMEEDLFYESDD